MLNAMQHHLTAEDLASVRGDLISSGGEPASERDGDWLADLGRDPDWVWEPTDEEIEEMARRAAEAERGQRTLECFVCDGLGCRACAQTGLMTVDEFLSEPLPPMPAAPQPSEDEDDGDDPEFEYESADDWAVDEYGLEHDDFPYYEID